jgi:integral membrane protein
MTNEKLYKSLDRFRKVAFAEGLSFLVLLGIAMPLKYFANWDKAVKYIGMLHGILFVAFILLAFDVFTKFRKPFVWLIKAFFASLLPFGTFIFDRELKKDADSLRLP